ncbi:SDR family oxidoreductase [Curtobacterium sp. MCLR17_031]|uniref:SDR family oxidoreductase n=1 Tax=Curtobacterium sp. MCLR17_031 TaxID=2175622 RepID=UPI000DAA51F6|nr:SDR family oxidoreductase [Curtobacterium sp. MCLR17_031]WIE58655.1 SDR family oxidoreductase [Curtobacterium sp. MCLR17_031]
MTSARPLALVTGVGRRAGIGAALATRLATDGWDLAISWWGPYDDRVSGGADPDGVESVVQECEAAGARVTRLPVDLEDPEQAAALVGRAETEAGAPVTALVMSHCESVDSDFRTTTVESWDRHFAVNARAPFLLVQAYAAGLERAGEAAPRDRRRIVALTSDHIAYNLPYGASKGALDRIVFGAAKELGSLGVSANVVNPGPNDTGWMSDEVKGWAVEGTPLGRLGRPTDTAALVGFLCSEQGAWMNGQLLKSDGGISNSA